MKLFLLVPALLSTLALAKEPESKPYLYKQIRGPYQAEQHRKNFLCSIFADKVILETEPAKKTGSSSDKKSHAVKFNGEIPDLATLQQTILAAKPGKIKNSFSASDKGYTSYETLYPIEIKLSITGGKKLKNSSAEVEKLLTFTDLNCAND